MNNKARLEMEIACKQMKEALDKFNEMNLLVKESLSHMEEANATSINSNAACYQEIKRQIMSEYGILMDAIDILNLAFNGPKIKSMVSSNRDNKD